MQTGNQISRLKKGVWVINLLKSYLCQGSYLSVPSQESGNCYQIAGEQPKVYFKSGIV